MTWRALLEQWPLVESDLQDAGVDVDDPVVRRERSWRWGHAKISGLLDTPVAGYARVPVDKDHERVVPIWRTRVQAYFYGAKE